MGSRLKIIHSMKRQDFRPNVHFIDATPLKLMEPVPSVAPLGLVIRGNVGTRG